MTEKQWLVAETISSEFTSKFPQLDGLLLQLLWNRNLRDENSIIEFLQPDWGGGIHDPFLFRDMPKAVESIYDAIGQKRKIGIFGDYDADGVCASVILVTTLNKLGAQTEIYLPHREREGYGLNEEAIRYLKEKGVSLLITCDCGVANVAQVKYANSLGLSVIVTDHHQPQKELPPASCILHPSLDGETYPFKLLSGGGVAFKLVQGLLKYDGCPLPDKEKEAHEKWLTDLVAISTIADMVKLVGENRTLVKYGLQVLRKTKRLGLKKLLEAAGVIPEKIDAYTVSWQIAPRINAAGRMDHANTAFTLLMSHNEAEADNLARAVNLTNTERQRLTEEMITQAKEQIGKIGKGDYFIHAFSAEWPLGLVGLVAGKLVQEYNRPALVMCQAGDKISGSGRSGVGDFNLASALAESHDYLISYGGHKEAAGFSMASSELEKFLKQFNKIAKRELVDKELAPSLMVDCEINFAQIDWPLIEQVNLLEPFGQANPTPRFLSRGARVVGLQPVGSNSQHLRLELEAKGNSRRFIWFKVTEEGMRIAPGDIVDLVYEVGVNEWNNERRLELKVVDLKIATDKG